MNICIFSNFFLPKTGGSSHYAHDLALSLKKKKHNVIVITSQLAREHKLFEEIKGVKVYRLPSLTYPKLGIAHGFDLRWTLLPWNFKKIYDILIDEEVNVIHTCGQFMDLVVPSAIFSKILNIPSVLSIHTRVEHTNSFYNSILSFADKTIVKLLVRMFDTVIALDKPCHEYIYKRYNPEHVEIIFTGVRFPKTENVERDKIVLSVSHITNLKDPTPLIEAIPTVLKKHPDTKFVFVGRVCNYKPVMLAKELGVEDSVLFTGAIPYDKVEQWYSKAIIEAHDMNLGLGIGSSALEAMAAGLCVLVAAKPDNFFKKSPIHRREAVYVVGEGPFIAYEINKILDNNLAETIGDNAKTFVKKYFYWPKIAKQFEELYALLIEERNNET